MRLINADEIPYESGEVSLGNGNYETVNIAYEGDIDAMETVDAVPVRHGKFVRIDEYDSQAGTNYSYITCSCCKAQIAHGWEHNIEIKIALGYKYCPYCGAEMDGEK